jgi:hypothetical protein
VTYELCSSLCLVGQPLCPTAHAEAYLNTILHYLLGDKGASVFTKPSRSVLKSCTSREPPPILPHDHGKERSSARSSSTLPIHQTPSGL